MREHVLINISKQIYANIPLPLPKEQITHKKENLLRVSGFGETYN